MPRRQVSLGESESKNWEVATNMTVGVGASKTTDEVDSGDDKWNEFGCGYTIKSALGSPKVTLQVMFGDDVNGNNIWMPVASSTSASDTLYTDIPHQQLRLKVEETGGTSSLDNIYVWVQGRTL